MMNNTLSITEYNLLDYSLKLQEAVEKGYRISDSVDGSPIMVGFVYTATLMKREAEELKGQIDSRAYHALCNFDLSKLKKE